MRRAALLLLLLLLPPAHAGHFGLGSAPDPELLESWDIDVGPDGSGLPVGHGSVAEGRKVYAAKCAACHGAQGQGGPMNRLVGGQGSLATAKPVKTVGSYWPYATTLYDYIRRSMPFDAPQSLQPDEIYAVCAFVLHLNGIVDADASLDAQSLPLVKMPNRDGFVPDPRPDTGGGNGISR